jgi:hypothetical protein
MARQKQETEAGQHIVTTEDAKGLPAMSAAATELAGADAVIMDSFDAIKAIGHIESAIFLRQVADKLIAETAIKVRESKQFKGLPYKDAAGNVRHVADFPEYCEVFLGKSYRRTMELISNYNQLGPELYEQAERLGFRQRDYNAIKALPADDKLLIAQAIEEENLDKALDLMQEMAAKHHREKEQLAKQTAALAETLEAKDKVIKDKTSVIDTQAERLALLENSKRKEDSQPVSAEQRLLDLRSNLQITTADLKANVMTRLRKGVKELTEHTRSDDAFAAACLIEISRELAILRDEYNLPSSLADDPTPEWMRDLDELPSVGSLLNANED